MKYTVAKSKWRHKKFHGVYACIGVGKSNKVLDDESEQNIN